MDDAVDDPLWRIYFAVAARFGIGALAVRMTVQRERVFPAEIIPVIDGQAHRHQRPITRQFAKQFVGGGARGATLTREKLDNGTRLGKSRRSHGTESEGDCKGDVAIVHIDPAIPCLARALYIAP